METNPSLTRAYYEARALEEAAHAFAEAIRIRLPQRSLDAPPEGNADIFVAMMGMLKNSVVSGKVDALATAFERKVAELIPDIVDAIMDCDIIMTSTP